MAEIIDGKQTAQEIRNEIKRDVAELVEQHGRRAPHLTAVLVGNDKASQIYVEHKMRAAREVGITSETRRLSEETSESELLAVIEQLNEDANVDAILVQLPVPEHINERRICNAVRLEKDVDGFHELNVGRMCLDMPATLPATALGALELLKRYNIETYGKNAVVVGRSKNVTMPIAMLLHADGKHGAGGLDATVTICHRYTPAKELTKHCLQADIIITATGVPGLIRSDMVKPGACVIDGGITRINNPITGESKLVGDVDFDAVREVAGYITPVPGGVGPMTVAMLLRNTVMLANNLALDQQN